MLFKKYKILLRLTICIALFSTLPELSLAQKVDADPIVSYYRSIDIYEWGELPENFVLTEANQVQVEETEDGYEIGDDLQFAYKVIRCNELKINFIIEPQPTPDNPDPELIERSVIAIQASDHNPCEQIVKIDIEDLQENPQQYDDLNIDKMDFEIVTPIKQIQVIDSHPGAREIITLNELNFIRERYTFNLDKKGVYSRLEKFEEYTNGVLSARHYYDEFLRLVKTEHYTKESTYASLSHIEEYDYDVTYGGITKTTNNSEGDILEIEKRNSDDMLLNAYRYNYNEYGDPLIDVINEKGVRISQQRFDADTDLLMETTFFDESGAQTGYRIYEYNQHKKKEKVLSFDAQGSMVEVLFYNSAGRLTKRERYANGELISTLTY